MGLLVWLLGLCSKLLVVFLCLLMIVIIVKLDATAADASTSKRENLDRKKKKSGGKEAKLDGKGSNEGGAKKKKGVEFMDDVVVVVRKSNDVEVSGKLGEDVELCEGMPEKVGFLANSSEGRLIVGREDDCNLMEDIDDVVVIRSVNHLDDFDKPTEAFEYFGEIAVKDGYIDRWMEEGLEVTRDEGGEISVGGCGDVNVTKNVERADGSKNIGTQAGAEVAEENREVIGYCGVKAGDAVTSCSEGLPAVQDINIDMLGTDDRLESVNDDDMVEQCSDAAAGKRIANKNAKYLEKKLQVRCLDDKSGLNLTSDNVAIDDIDGGMTAGVANDPDLLEAELGRHTVIDEDRVSLGNDHIVTDERVMVVGKRMSNSGEHLEGELDGEAIDGQRGMTINAVVAIAESDAAAGEIADGKSKNSEELERDAVEEKSDKFSGAEEDKISLLTNELENLVVEEVIKYKKSCNESNVELVSDNVAGCLIVAGRVVYEGEKGALRDKEVHDNGDHEHSDDDDDWEGVERSELEKVFAEAVNYVEYEWKLKDNWSANSRVDIPNRLYGLHKLATEGPCNVPPPMALKVTARAKWNAWQSLGNMSPEVAMEEYVKILSDADPEWMQDSTAEGDMRNSLHAGVEDSLDYKLTSSEDSQTNFGRTKIEKA